MTASKSASAPNVQKCRTGVDCGYCKPLSQTVIWLGMIIKRVQVEEGFLDGLDINFTRGLNVLIGPRGTGKTSAIELIRYCLGAPALTDKVAAQSRQHALSILGSGSVTVTVDDGKETFNVTRTADHWKKETTTEIRAPMILSQNEIETVGLHPYGRLRLIDSIGSHPDNDLRSEETFLAQIRSQTQERRSIHQELQTLRAQYSELSEQLKEADALKKSHSDVLKGIEKAKSETDRLEKLTAWLTALSVRAKVYGRTIIVLQQRERKIEALSSEYHDLEQWPSSAGGKDPLTDIRESLRLSNLDLESSLSHIRKALESIRALFEVNQADTIKYEEEARTIRRKLESLKAGAGEIARKLAVLQEKTGQQTALKSLIETKTIRLREIQGKRKVCLDNLESHRVERFTRRCGKRNHAKVNSRNSSNRGASKSWGQKRDFIISD
jgi:DNA repair exonuclease SbcCD ATPase subunit